MRTIIAAIVLLAVTHAPAQTPSQSNDAENQDGVWFENTMGRDKIKYGNSMLICFPKEPGSINAKCSIYLTNKDDHTIAQYYSYINPASGNVEFETADNNGKYVRASKEYRGKIPKSNLLEMQAEQWLKNQQFR